MSTVVQPCARCGSRWAVQGKPMHWCPRCRGVLLSPGPVDAAAQHRNYRWVARPPGRTARPVRQSPPTPNTRSTPRYREMPRWGLRDEPPRSAASPRPRLAALLARRDRLLVVTAVLFGLAAVAELGRYLVLLRNRSRLIHPAIVWASDTSVYVTAVLAAVVALASALALVTWLVAARRTAYADVGRRDGRPQWMLWCGCLIPVVNLVMVGVFLTELVGRRGDPRTLRAVRLWWCAWVLNGALVVLALCWHRATSLQAQADGVMLTVYTDLVAAALAVLTLWLVRLIEGFDLRGHVRRPKRWLPALGPAEQVIEPVHPAAESDGPAAAGQDGPTGGDGEKETARATDDPDAPLARASAAEQEEVMAK